MRCTFVLLSIHVQIKFQTLCATRVPTNTLSNKTIILTAYKLNDSYGQHLCLIHVLDNAWEHVSPNINAEQQDVQGLHSSIISETDAPTSVDSHTNNYLVSVFAIKRNRY